MILSDPVAIVGMGCRFAGAPDLAAFWNLLVEGRHGFREVPADRFSINRYHDAQPGRRGKVVTREGGFLENIRAFDAQLFSLSHREAALMDPQHRHLLEVAWLAVEDAGIPLEAIAGSRGGVFVGLFTGDYRERILRRRDFDFDVYSEIGSTRSSASGRLSHAFDLRGPSVAVDAACASSLMAVYLAAQSLVNGETEIALAGGCNVVLEPEPSICFSRSGMLSPDSRCKFGDASANGFVRSDGFGVVVLKRLSKALADGDRIYATIDAAGSNNDAKQGRGLYMTPSQEGQTALLEHVYHSSGINPATVHYVEAHGTGTRAGDPVELGAIAAILGAGRASTSPLRVGSVKTNIGHCEGAAGIASFIKAALVAHHRLIPPSLHFDTPNPDIPWEEGRLEIPSQQVPLPEDGPVRVGISSFGLSGTNAHIVLGATSPSVSNVTPEPLDETETAEHLLPLSAHRPEALRGLVERYRSFLKYKTNDAELAHVCFTAGARRSALSHRITVIGKTCSELAEGLEVFLEGDGAPAPVTAPAKVAFVYSGQGGQWVGMGRALLSADEAFRSAVQAIDTLVKKREGWSVVEAMTEPDAQWGISRIQPLIFTVQVALSRALMHHGLTPSALVGHSMGEVAAAHIAGALSLEDAVCVICARSRQLARIQGQGGMAVVGMGVAEAEAEIGDFAGVLSVAVSNSARSTVIAGAPEALEAVLERLTAREVFCRRVDVDVASHSPQTEQLLGDLCAEVEACNPQPCDIPLYSTVEIAQKAGPDLGPDYWASNMRCAVRFAQTTEAMIADGVGVFVEIGPHPVLVNALLQTLEAAEARAVAVGAMHRDLGTVKDLLSAMGAAWAAGAPVDWARACAGGRITSLPSYAFYHEDFWFEDDDEAAVESAGTRLLADGSPAHPLLPRRYQLASMKGAVVWEVPLSIKRFAYLKDHRVRGSAVLPGAAYVEIALAVAQEAFPGLMHAVEDVAFKDTLVVPSTRPCVLQVQMTPAEDGRQGLRFYSLDEGDGQARIHATGWLRIGAEAAAERDLASPSQPALGDWELLHEELTVELYRRRQNPEHVFGLITVDVLRAGDDSLLERVDSELRRVVRQGDLVLSLDEGPFVVMPRNARDAERVSLAVQRIREGLMEGLGLGEESFTGRVRLTGAMVDDTYSDAASVMGAIIERSLKGGELEAVDSLPLGSLDRAQMYEGMEALGIHYGPAFQMVEHLKWGAASAHAELKLPERVVEELKSHVLHPAALDGIFQGAAGAFILGSEGDDTWLPVGVRRLRVCGRLTHNIRVRSWLRGQSDDGGEVELDFVIENGAGKRVVAADGLRLLRVDKPSNVKDKDSIEGWLYAWEWAPVPLPPEADGDPPCVALSIDGDGPLAVAVARGLGQAGLYTSEPGGPRIIVAEGGGPESGSALMEASIALCQRVMEAAQALSGGQTLWVVTAGAEVAERGDDAPSLLLGPLKGLARTIANERPEIKVRLVDMPRQASPEDVACLLAVLARGTDEEELAIRAGATLARRLDHLVTRAEPRRTVSREVGVGGGWALAGRRRGARWSPTIVTFEPSSPGPGEVAIEVISAQIDGAAVVSGAFRGGMCAGKVIAVGSEVTGKRPGDVVLAAVIPSEPGDGTLIARRVCLPESLLARLPFRDRPDVAVASASVYLPAQLALSDLGGLRPGERLLIRGGDGPLGPAAAVYARRVGAHVIATGATVESRRRLRMAGAELVLDSHSSVDAPVLELTGGEGLDVVLELQHLPGLEQVIKLMRPAGRILDLSGQARPDLCLDLSIGALCYVALDVDALVAQRPGFVGASLRKLVPSLVSGGLPSVEPAPLMAVDAFVETLHEEGEIPGEGPAVVSLDVPSLMAKHTLTPQNAFRPDGTYLLTGGTGGLGLAFATRLAERGAGQLVLISRSGRQGPAFDEAKRRIEALGSRVEIRRADVSDGMALGALIGDLEASRPPIRGVFHLAAILDDATLDKQDSAHFRRSMGPKLLGAWHLDRLTQHLPLDHFVLFSSVAAVIGSPGQANYAAANAGLEALAAVRRQRGQVALAIDWGTWGEIGLAAAQENRGARLEDRGMPAMAPDRALEAFERALFGCGGHQVGIFAMDWDQWARSMPRFQRSPMVSRLVTPPADAGDELDGQSLVARLEVLKPAERQLMCGVHVRSVLGDVLRMPASRIGPGQGLAQLGLDSLMTVELRSRLLDNLGVELSTTRILAMSDVNALSEVVCEALQGGEAAKETEVEVETLEIVTLDETIRPEGEVRVVANPTAVFLTGATGFVGAHLLRELIDQTSAQIHCLVRARDAEAAVQRLQETLSGYQLWNPGDASRLRVVVGDLSKARFGLDHEAFAKLADSVEAIYHAGALVNHVFPYVRLVAANVQGTQEVLRLACMGTPKAVHHISTLAVYPFTTEGADLPWAETDPLGAFAEPFFAGYGQSKWMAEQLVHQARERGLVARVYRPGAVTGSRHAALCPRSDLVWRLAEAAARMGMAPSLPGGIGFTPVDAVAAAVVELSRIIEPGIDDFHVFGEALISFDDACAALAGAGYPVEVTELAEWLGAVAAGHPGAEPLKPVLPRLEAIDLTGLAGQDKRAHSAGTLALLSAQTRQAMVVDHALLTRYVASVVGLPPEEGAKRAQG